MVVAVGIWYMTNICIIASSSSYICGEMSQLHACPVRYGVVNAQAHRVVTQTLLLVTPRHTEVHHMFNHIQCYLQIDTQAHLQRIIIGPVSRVIRIATNIKRGLCTPGEMTPTLISIKPAHTVRPRYVCNLQFPIIALADATALIFADIKWFLVEIIAFTIDALATIKA
eukprot:GHVO01010227.1.p1 GENE.GHVO01010227.1~~GHVO01010227.1.p1  ORF type:complete len:169 (-),score=11.42 GHVO01010227.1:104-610(-)